MDNKKIENTVRKVVSKYMDKNCIKPKKCKPKQLSTWIVQYQIQFEGKEPETHFMGGIPARNGEDAEFLLVDFYRKIVGDYANVDFTIKTLDVVKEYV